ncbi:MAG: penicillin-binding protein 1C [Bacteroidetes bacterium]|nr:penicillin-binding protein 1C [Bacteroidota bacterium]
MLAAVAVADRLLPPPAMPDYSVQVFDRRGELLGASLTADDKWRLRTRLDHVSPELLRAVVAKEDRWFFFHRGVNPFAVARALWGNVVAGRRASGASTITMQLARLLEPDRRTYAVKLREMLRALQLEIRYSKREILESYISLLPMGGNIEGVSSASWIYFNRPPEKLSLAQAVALSVIPNNPNRLRLDRSSGPVQQEARRWLRRFGNEGVFSPADIATAIGEDFTVARSAPPRRAPHFTLVAQERRSAATDLVHTTLDPAVQDAAEQLLFNHVQRVLADGVRNGAVLVIDNDSMTVAAWCGSSDFHDVLRHGQVDGVRAVRSPGSTLKPFLYARAFDEGVLTPRMRLLDIPGDFGGYIPENYDATFSGDVSVREALLRSLNVPAVRELARQGTGQFVSWLTSAGFATIARTREKLGLSLILGGCGVTLEELTRATSMFARGGDLASLRLMAGTRALSGATESDREAGARAMCSAGAAWLVTDILSGHERPDLPADLRATSRLPRFAWKTGTSYGKRDAWAVGWNARYTIGVWMGNFTGEGAPHLSGAEMAVPLLVDIFDAIDERIEAHIIPRPTTVAKRDVCARTGLLPSERCEHLVQDWYIRNVSSRRRCDLQRPFILRADRGIHYCMDCVPDSGTVEEWYPVPDPELAMWYDEHRVSQRRPPPHNPACTVRGSGDGPRILSPSPDYTYLLERGAEQQILLQAASGAGVRTLYWYVNGKLEAETGNGGKVFVAPEGTTLRITCMDDAGRKSAVTVRIQYY